jgi:hypothetical protein
MYWQEPCEPVPPVNARSVGTREGIMRIRATNGRLLVAAPLARLGILALACIVLAACGSASPTGPSQQGSLRLTAGITRSVIPAGGTATITFRLDNLGSDTVTLLFGDSCQISPYIASASGLIVYPEGGGWVCATVITSLTLPPGGSKSQEVQVQAAADASYPYVALGAGEYSAFAKVESRSYTLRSDPVRFTVQ